MENTASSTLTSSSKSAAVVKVVARAALDQELDQLIAAVRHVATPETTWRSYAKALRYFGAWMQCRYGQPWQLPTPVPVVQQFVLDHFGRPERVSVAGGTHIELHPVMPKEVDTALVAYGYKAALGQQKMATIDHRLAVLSWAHREQGFDDSPCQDSSVRRLLADCRKIARERGEGPRTKTAATQDALEAMLATCDDSLEGLRDRALLLFGWSSGGRRRSEIAAAMVSDMEWLDEQRAVFRMRQSKTGDIGPKPIKDEAACALRVWLQSAKISEGFLFRRVWGPRVGAGLSPHAIGAIIKRRAYLAGLDGDFSGHSLRRGFVTEAGLQQIPLGQTMAMTGHRLAKTTMRYYEVGDLLNSDAADLLSRGRNGEQGRKSSK